ncbi:MAG: glycosyltransferase [Ferruginibacter sp.]
MTLLISIPWFYPAYKAGGPIQSVQNLVNNYQDPGYFIITGKKDADGSPVAIAGFDKWNFFSKNTQVCYTNKPVSEINNAVKKFNPQILFIIGLFDFNFNIRPLFFSKIPVKILSARGMLHPGALSQKHFKKKLFIFLMKLSGIHKKILFHATNETEKKYISAIFGSKAKVMVAQNFPHLVSKKENIAKVPQRLNLVTIALISPMKNHALVLDALQSCKGEINYVIYGPVKDKAYWEVCLQKISTLPPNIRVQYEGEIRPEHIETALHKADVFIMPSKSENYGHAIIEALSAGLPVITSQHTPWQNLQENKAGFNTAQTAAEIAVAISNFTAMDAAVFNEWCSAASAYAHEHTRVDTIKAQYDQLFSVAG